MKTPTPIADRSDAFTANLLRFLEGQWLLEASHLGPTIGAADRRVLVALLLEVHSRTEPLTKEKAYVAMGATKRVGKKCVGLAEELEFVFVEKLTADPRKRVLLPTDKLRNVLTAELRELNASAAASGALYPDSAILAQSSQQAKKLVNDFVQRACTGSNVLAEIAHDLPLAADFYLAQHGPSWWSDRLATPMHAGYHVELLRPLFLGGRVKIFPGHVHQRYLTGSDPWHPDDLEAAATWAKLCRRVREIQPTREGFRFAQNFHGTLIVLGDVISNALTRLVLQFKLVTERGLALESVKSPIAKRRFQYIVAGPYTPTARGRSYSIYDSKKGKNFRAEFADGKQITDYLLITWLPNFLTTATHKTGDRIIICSGIHGAGTKAIDLVFRDKRVIDKIAGIAKKRKGMLTEHQVLLKVAKIDHSGERPQPVELDSNFIEDAEVHIDDAQLSGFIGLQP